MPYFGEQGGLPLESALLFAPRNNSTRDISKATPPGDTVLRELAFVRLVALALGIPPGVLLQVATAFSKRPLWLTPWLLYSGLIEPLGSRARA